MELKVRIGYEELLRLIRQLPTDQLLMLQKELEKFRKEKSTAKSSKLKELALSAPIMSEEQFDNFQNFRAELNKWREG